MPPKRKHTTSKAATSKRVRIDPNADNESDTITVMPTEVAAPAKAAAPAKKPRGRPKREGPAPPKKPRGRPKRDNNESLAAAPVKKRVRAKKIVPAEIAAEVPTEAADETATEIATETAAEIATETATDVTAEAAAEGAPEKGKAKGKERRKSGVKPTEKTVEVVRDWVLERLMGRRRGNMVGVEEEYGNVHNLLEQTVVAGEGNSMLIIGGRGSGKSTLVETAITDLTQDHKGEFLVVRLNGFFQTDDKLALREIWRQLGVEMELDEQDQPKTTNFADTLSSILAILSHPDELQPEDPDTDPPDQDKDPESSRRTTLSVIFVLDEFDLFVTHPRQTLLYNLFDIAQARKAPIAVIGLTCRIDVVESLEKRVKSRFSHRSVHLRLPNSIGKFWERCKEGLKIDLAEFEESKGELEPAERKWVDEWNESLETLLKEDKVFARIVERIYAQSKDLKAFFNACLMPVAELSVETPMLRGEAFVNNGLAAPESKLHVLDGLTELELSLIISAARLDIISDTDTCNFSMAYDEYKGLISKIKVQSSVAGVSGGKLWSREVALGAWERLGEYELIIPALVGGGGAAGGVGREGRMWRVDVGLREIGRSVRGLSAVMAKWCKEV
ncbi:origin recognition complex subunit 4 [Rhizina undulata]